MILISRCSAPAVSFYEFISTSVPLPTWNSITCTVIASPTQEGVAIPYSHSPHYLRKRPSNNLSGCPMRLLRRKLLAMTVELPYFASAPDQE